LAAPSRHGKEQNLDPLDGRSFSEPTAKAFLVHIRQTLTDQVLDRFDIISPRRLAPPSPALPLPNPGRREYFRTGASSRRVLLCANSERESRVGFRSGRQKMIKMRGLKDAEGPGLSVAGQQDTPGLASPFNAVRFLPAFSATEKRRRSEQLPHVRRLA